MLMVMPSSQRRILNRTAEETTEDWSDARSSRAYERGWSLRRPSRRGLRRRRSEFRVRRTVCAASWL